MLQCVALKGTSSLAGRSITITVKLLLAETSMTLPLFSITRTSTSVPLSSLALQRGKEREGEGAKECERTRRESAHARNSEKQNDRKRD